MAIISTSGGKFKEETRDFRFIGVNNYPLIQNEYSVADLNSFFAACQGDGIKVVRCWCYNKADEPADSAGFNRYLNVDELAWREDWFVAMDNVLDRAAAYGIKITLPLVDNYPQSNNWGTKQQYCYWSNTINENAWDRYNYGDDFHVQEDMKTWFKEYIAKLCGRTNTVNSKDYVDDDTIFAWELGNELRFTSGDDSGANQNTADSYRIGVLTSWQSEMAAYIKSQDSNHMVGSGGLMQYFDWVADDPVHNGSYYGVDYDLQHQDANIDYYDFHLYAYADSPTFTLNAYGQSLGESGGTDGLLAQIDEFITDAKTEGKPVVVGEWGVDKRNEDVATYVAYPRATHFNNIMNDYFTLGGDGFMIWHYTNLFDDNNYNVKPDGVHTGDNANDNLNDDDTLLRAAILSHANALDGTRNALSTARTGVARSPVSTPRGAATGRTSIT